MEAARRPMATLKKLEENLTSAEGDFRYVIMQQTQVS